MSEKIICDLDECKLFTRNDRDQENESKQKEAKNNEHDELEDYMDSIDNIHPYFEWYGIQDKIVFSELLEMNVNNALQKLLKSLSERFQANKMMTTVNEQEQIKRIIFGAYLKIDKKEMIEILDIT